MNQRTRRWIAALGEAIGCLGVLAVAWLLLLVLMSNLAYLAAPHRERPLPPSDRSAAEPR